MSKIKKIEARGVPVVGNDIDTDRIIPARYLKEITFSKMGDYPFYDERFTPEGKKKDHSFNKPEYQGAGILVANSNFGCGSSREHAPQSLVRWGIRAIVAESYAEIFAGNCVMLGTPAVVASKDDVAAIQKWVAANPEAQLVLDLEAMILKVGDHSYKITMPETRRNALLEGTWDSTSLLLANKDKIEAIAASLPYMAWTQD
ncbi:MAG: 3-isopropylmalate dehydratase small subunit [Spirochaetales bacterium]|nr:3-isopropylmalate dehydratase small subunit [Spirochaetales bacterium]